MVAVITNGTAILGLGNIGPLAGLPVMEGKAALFADLAQEDELVPDPLDKAVHEPVATAVRQASLRG